MRELYETGVWTIFSTLDPRVLQFKPGLLMAPELVEELLGRMADGIARAQGAGRPPTPEDESDRAARDRPGRPSRVRRRRDGRRDGGRRRAGAPRLRRADLAPDHPVRERHLPGRGPGHGLHGSPARAPPGLPHAPGDLLRAG